jgi:hypothetical protein
MAREAQSNTADSSGRERSFEPALWERMIEETPKAYAAFRMFRDQGVQRSYAATARALGRHESQIRRWAGPFRWRERAHAWDLVQSREVELLLRQEREQAARRRMRHAEQIEKMAMAGIAKLVTRDPQTGEPQLSPLLTPQMAVKLYDLVLKIESSLPGPRNDGESPSRESIDPLTAFSDAELKQILALARARAFPEGGSESDNHPS